LSTGSLDRPLPRPYRWSGLACRVRRAEAARGWAGRSEPTGCIVAAGRPMTVYVRALAGGQAATTGSYPGGQGFESPFRLFLAQPCGKCRWLNGLEPRHHVPILGAIQLAVQTGECARHQSAHRQPAHDEARPDHGVGDPGQGAQRVVGCLKSAHSVKDWIQCPIQGVLCDRECSKVATTRGRCERNATPCPMPSGTHSRP
jgi:hypothetical protein